METVKLSTIIKHVDPKLEIFLTFNELEMPVVLRNGIESVSQEDILEIIEVSINLKNNGVLLH